MVSYKDDGKRLRGNFRQDQQAVSEYASRGLGSDELPRASLELSAWPGVSGSLGRQSPCGQRPL